MKKIISISALLFAGIMFAGASAFAGTLSTTGDTGGSTLTLDSTNDPGPGMDYNPSPNNLMAIVTSTNYYAIESMNTAAANDTRMEYGIWSNNTGYYQQVNGDTQNPVVIQSFTVDFSASTDPSVNPFTGSDWTPVGGGSSS